MIRQLTFLYPNIILALLALVLPCRSIGASESYGSPHPDAPAELLEFSFLIGPWECELDWLQPDGSRAQGKATWTGRWMMDGWAIQDDFRDGFVEGYRATTFRAWDRREQAWRGYWLDGRSGSWSNPLIEEEVEPSAGLRLRTSATFQNAEGQPVDVEMRYHFHEITERRFSWRQDTSLDQGATWQESTTAIECSRPSRWQSQPIDTIDTKE